MIAESYQLFSLCITQGKCTCSGKRHIHFQYAVFARISKAISETGH
jgi:hypothetical protein